MTSKRSLTGVVVIALIMAVGLVPAANAATKPTAAQRAQLQYLVEEEKLARDVYLYLAANVTSSKFANIARAEQVHMDEVGAILKTYKFTNPTSGRARGVFVNKTLQSLYTNLTAKGSTDIWAAYQVGIDIENLDISDIQNDLKIVMPTDMKLMLNRLLNGSISHLAAFTR